MARDTQCSPEWLPSRGERGLHQEAGAMLRVSLPENDIPRRSQVLSVRLIWHRFGRGGLRIVRLREADVPRS